MEHARWAVTAIQDALDGALGCQRARRQQEALAIAQHNVAVELEHLGRISDAMEVYHRAECTAAQMLGVHDPVKRAPPSDALKLSPFLSSGHLPDSHMYLPDSNRYGANFPS